MSWKLALGAENPLTIPPPPPPPKKKKEVSFLLEKNKCFASISVWHYVASASSDRTLELLGHGKDKPQLMALTDCIF
jgi:hypothetical protein